MAVTLGFAVSGEEKSSCSSQTPQLNTKFQEISQQQSEGTDLKYKVENRVTQDKQTQQNVDRVFSTPTLLLPGDANQEATGTLSMSLLGI